MLNNIQYYHKLKQNAPSFINAIKLHYITKLTNLIINEAHDRIFMYYKI